MKKYLVGFFITYLIFINPLGIIAQEAVDNTPAVDSSLAEAPVVEPVVDPIADPVVEPEPLPEPEPPAAEPLEPPAEEPVEPPTEEPQPEPPTDPPIEDPTDPPIEDPTDPPIEEPVDPPADPPTEPTPEVPANPQSDHLIINEIMIGSEVNPEKELWIELYNPTNQEVNLEGWQIRGVTKGGRWIDVVNDPTLTIPANEHFLLSRYSNSRYSALAIKPEMTKDSLFFPDMQITVELKNPSDEIVDQAVFEHVLGSEFRSYERNCLMLDGTLPENWISATAKINLKPDLLITYGTPHSPNSMCELAEEPVDPPTDPPVEEPVDPPVEEPVDPPVEEPIEDPVDPPVDPPVEKPIEDPVDPPVDPPAEEPIEEPVDPPAEEPIEEPMDPPAEEPIDPPTEPPVEEPVDPPITDPAEPPVEDPPTEEPDPPVDPPTDPPPPSSGGGGGSAPPPPPVYPTYQLINEFMPNPAGTDTEGEWIELKNSTSEVIDLSNWYLDDAEGSSSPFKIPSGTIISPGQHLVFTEPGLGLSLKNSDDQVRLLDPNKNPKEIISYSGCQEDLSFAKNQNGQFEWTPLFTPGQPNQFPEPPKSYAPDTVVFKTVLPNPDGKDTGLEEIILKSNYAEVLDLTDWKFVNLKGKSYALTSLILPPYQSLIINPADLNLTLTNTADQLSLIDPAGNLIDRIDWQNAPSGELIYKSDFFHDGLSAKVTHVVDGDTFKVLIDGEPYTVRMIGVDTPEIVHPNQPVEEFGIEASNYTKSLLENQTVTLNFDIDKMDKYNRLLAYVHANGQFVNAEIIKNGYGRAYTRYPFMYLEDFVEYEKYAKENGLGIWQNEVVAEELGSEDENTTTEETEPPKTDQITEATDQPATEPINCPLEGLKIDAILPNAEKGVTQEFIRLINTSDQTVCLTGWQLDDNIIKGSRPFSIRGGGIAAGGVRTFRKSETGIALNNSNDCATLINPEGEVVDQICYNKTHKNEIFTHEGGNYVAPPKKSKSRSSKRTKSTTRSATDYKWELINETLAGNIEYIYEEGEVMYLKNTERAIAISYANSDVDIHMTKQLLDFSHPVIVDVRTLGEDRELIGIRQGKIPKEALPKKPKFPAELKYLLLLLILIGGFYLFKKIYNKKLAKTLNNDKM